MLLPTTLTTAAAAALINVWLIVRIERLRFSDKVVHGDGGHALLARRMRAQSNFIENAPLVLILIAVIELAGSGALWLAVVAGLFVLGRVAHGLGMDSPKPNPLRALGTLTAILAQVGLAVVAVLIAVGRV